MGEATDEDLVRLAGIEGRDPSDWRLRLARGNVCLLARYGLAPIGYVWASRSPELMTEVDHTVDVSRDPAGAYLYDGYVLPEHRRKGVLRALLAYSKGWARQRGLARLYAAFARDNHASERALRQAGFTTVVGDIALVRVLRREWKRVRVPQDGTMADILRTDGRSRWAPRPA